MPATTSSACNGSPVCRTTDCDRAGREAGRLTKRILPMGYKLRKGVSFCLTDDHLIFLDLKTGRYSTLSQRVAHAFKSAQIGNYTAEIKATLNRLAVAGLIEHGETEGLLAPTSRTPVSNSVLDAHWCIVTPTSPIVLLAIIKGVFQCKTQNLSAVLGRLKILRCHLGRTANVTEETEQLALQFVSARAFLPLRDRCLAESTALVACLAHRQIHASIVFGVSGRPFAAHCWVEINGTVLNDSLEHVNSFQPILYA